MTVSQWRSYAVAHMDEQLIAVILQLQREFLEHYGSWPTVAQILSQLEGVQKES